MRGRATQRRRSTANAVCLVVRGEGESTVGERRFRWGPRDVFTVPHWSWVQHTAAQGDAASARKHWQRLLDQVPPDAPERADIQRLIDELPSGD